jgi:hypothetical protein
LRGIRIGGDNIEMDLYNRVGGYGLDICGLWQRQMVAPPKHGNESWDSVKDGEFFD